MLIYFHNNIFPTPSKPKISSNKYIDFEHLVLDEAVKDHITEIKIKDNIKDFIFINTDDNDDKTILTYI